MKIIHFKEDNIDNSIIYVDNLYRFSPTIDFVRRISLILIEHCNVIRWVSRKIRLVLGKPKKVPDVVQIDTCTIPRGAINRDCKIPRGLHWSPVYDRYGATDRCLSRKSRKNFIRWWLGESEVETLNSSYFFLS